MQEQGPCIVPGELTANTPPDTPVEIHVRVRRLINTAPYENYEVDLDEKLTVRAEHAAHLRKRLLDDLTDNMHAKQLAFRLRLIEDQEKAAAEAAERSLRKAMERGRCPDCNLPMERENKGQIVKWGECRNCGWHPTDAFYDGLLKLGAVTIGGPATIDGLEIPEGETWATEPGTILKDRILVIPTPEEAAKRMAPEPGAKLDFTMEPDKEPPEKDFENGEDAD